MSLDIPDQKIVSCVVLDPKSKTTATDIEYKLRQLLPYWAIPEDIFVIDSTPRHGPSKNVCMLCLRDQIREMIEPRMRLHTSHRFPF